MKNGATWLYVIVAILAVVLVAENNGMIGGSLLLIVTLSVLYTANIKGMV